MNEDYEVIFQMTDNCEKMIKKHPLDEKTIDKIMTLAEVYYDTGMSPHVRPIRKEFLLKNHLESTLYIIRLGIKERALVSIDVDEIFNQLIVTLWGFTSNHDYKKMFRKIGESLYQEYLCNGEGDQ